MCDTCRRLRSKLDLYYETVHASFTSFVDIAVSLKILNRWLQKGIIKELKKKAEKLASVVLKIYIRNHLIWPFNKLIVSSRGRSG
jgi:hypothetical protein